jgi:hypothetical protein
MTSIVRSTLLTAALAMTLLCINEALSSAVAQSSFHVNKNLYTERANAATDIQRRGNRPPRPETCTSIFWRELVWGLPDTGLLLPSGTQCRTPREVLHRGSCPRPTHFLVRAC